MIAKRKIYMNLWQRGLPKRIEVIQNDCYTRAVEFCLFSGEELWLIPEGVTAVVSFRKEDGTGGEYDTLPDGSRAWEVEGNRLTVLLAPQVMTVPGDVELSVALVCGEKVLNTFTVEINVLEQLCADSAASEDYRKIWGFMPLPASAQVGQAIVVKSVDGRGKPTAVETKPYSIVQDMGLSETAVMSQRAVTDALVRTQQTSPEFVAGIEDCTDTGKLYVLPDGCIYAYMETTFPGGLLCTNLATAFETGRLNSSGAVSTSNATGATTCTDYIPFAEGDVVRVKGFGPLDDYMIAQYNGSQTCVNASVPSKDTTGRYTYTYDDTTGVATLVCAASTVSYLRISGVLAGTADDVIITHNEEIEEGTATTEYRWTNTGHAYQPADYEDRIIELETAASKQGNRLELLQKSVERLEDNSAGNELPDYWEEYLAEKLAAIRALHESCGKDCFSFPLLTDMHIAQNLGMRSGLLARRIMDGCHLRHALCLGDAVTRSAVETAEMMDASFEAVEQALASIRDRLLQTQGNHDGAWGASDLDGDGEVKGVEYYCRNFTPQKLHSLIYRKVGLVGQVCFDSSGSGYYADDEANKVRYIILNSHHLPYAEHEDGTAKYNTMRMFRFGQSQYDLVVRALCSVPDDDWAVVTASHVPLNDKYTSIFGGEEGDHVLMRRLLAAYKEKRAFSGSFAGTVGVDAVSVEADFSTAKGQYMAHFAGHAHADTCGEYDGITVITTRCDGQNEDNAEQYAQRKAGTVTEQSFDVFTVDRATRTIYATKVGAGDDRIIRC